VRGAACWLAVVVPVVVLGAWLTGRRGLAPWACTELGTSHRCTQRAPPALLSPPFRCHEEHGRQLCFGVPAAKPGPPWICLATAGVCYLRTEYPSGGADHEWRCGSDATGVRTCSSKTFGNAPFQCAGGVCRQPYPDYPSDDEWECYEGQGRTVCRTEEAHFPLDPLWRCASRGRSVICVDPEPDLPDSSRDWVCKYHAQGGARECRALASAACSADSGCSCGACLDGQCVRPLAADCFDNHDCKVGKCIAGLCC